ncbi:hypothetical protein SAMN02745119_00237 [Trichlorobacter thiogenes]|uniref:Uncharacterized protein n=1 Tax=Trichlorobacter thiogenes TaxID=115783 RepID=A0A1T4K152_9BACT|nr:hypothetical protein [Trichlorobacter thiogenes]SJZ36047.1 hypothetical protein SAMN02745119_00237 [Trichlorobacter thiogenes]
MPLTAEQQEQLRIEYIDLIGFYQKVKQIVITSERANKEQKLSVPAIVELRSAFDHVARAHAVLYQLPIAEEYEGDEFKYCHKNLDKAHGHLYRAAYDAYDVIAIALAEEIDEYLDSFSKNTLFVVIPDASAKIIRPFEEAKTLVTAEKCRKDVTCKAEEEEQFSQYEKAADQLVNVKDEILRHMASLAAYDAEQKQAQTQAQIQADRRHKTGTYLAIGGILISIVSIVIGVVLSSGPVGAKGQSSESNLTFKNMSSPKK